jgi:hypothetical protein
MEKKDWQKTFSNFVKKILEKKTKDGANEDSIKAFKANAGLFVKYISSKFDQITMYTPKDYDSENSLVFSYWKNEEDEAPVFIFYLDGMKFFKV